jgi:glycosyltransferase involved in cell wall biosynthesis
MGLPVYNGEAFLARAIGSLLAQTYRDFELIICDNASTDATESICRAFAGRDPRIRYFRNEKNVGAMGNFRRAFDLSRGELFKWSAHDDEHEPEFVERCVAVLDADPRVVLAYTCSREIDETGTTLRVRSTGVDASHDAASRRFRELVRRDYPCVAAFGVARSGVLRRTRLFQNYADCDRVLLAEIGLQGRIVELPEPLFVHRQHRNRSVWQYRSRQTRNAWFDPAMAGRPAFPYAKQFRGYLGAIRRAPASRADRARCAAVMAGWVVHNLDGLWEDVTFAGRYALRPVKRRVVRTGRDAKDARPKRSEPETPLSEHEL